LKSLINYDKISFYRLLLKEREENKMPPFGRLYTIIITGYNDKEVKLYAINFLRNKPKEIQSLGPAPGLIHPLRNRYSYRFLLMMGKNNKQNHDLINIWMKYIDTNNKNIKVKLDVDPLIFL
ncbi:MAG: hypothetical protein OEY79_02255, partial [Anaplasmataceae bacterium]|nr:hypothetical protein [Anaplasmataceae bacterium]